MRLTAGINCRVVSIKCCSRTDIGFAQLEFEIMQSDYRHDYA
jgi:hypothetical protein